jgi:hypothetical protein
MKKAVYRQTTIVGRVCRGIEGQLNALSAAVREMFEQSLGKARLVIAQARAPRGWGPSTLRILGVAHRLTMRFESQ